MTRDFSNFVSAMAYASQVRAEGFSAYIEEFYGLDGRYYSVLVW